MIREGDLIRSSMAIHVSPKGVVRDIDNLVKLSILASKPTHILVVCKNPMKYPRYAYTGHENRAKKDLGF